ncbi:MAG: hypothetical protein ACK5KM_14990, partial [Hyphomicrobiaceae bacterium]
APAHCASVLKWAVPVGQSIVSGMAEPTTKEVIRHNTMKRLRFIACLLCREGWINLSPNMTLLSAGLLRRVSSVPANADALVCAWSSVLPGISGIGWCATTRDVTYAKRR